MNSKRRIILTSITAVVVVLVLIFSIRYINKPEKILKKQIDKFERLMTRESLKDITMTIYYYDPYIHRDIHWSIDQLIEVIDVYDRNYNEQDFPFSEYDFFSLSISGESLELYRDYGVWHSITYDNIQLAEEPTGVKGKLDARIYIVFKQNEKAILNIAMWSCGKYGLPEWDGRWLNVYVNGIEVEGNRCFTDMILPFLRRGHAEHIESYVTGVIPYDIYKSREDFDAIEPNETSYGELSGMENY